MTQVNYMASNSRLLVETDGEQRKEEDLCILGSSLDLADDEESFSTML